MTFSYEINEASYFSANDYFIGGRGSGVGWIGCDATRFSLISLEACFVVSGPTLLTSAFFTASSLTVASSPTDEFL